MVSSSTSAQSIKQWKRREIESGEQKKEKKRRLRSRVNLLGKVKH